MAKVATILEFDREDKNGVRVVQVAFREGDGQAFERTLKANGSACPWVQLPWIVTDPYNPTEYDRHMLRIPKIASRINNKGRSPN